MIFITGDCHGDWRRFSVDNFQEQRTMSKNDFVIVCGDFGIWHDTPEERYWLKWLNDKPFTTLFVDGNHENFDRLYGGEFETVEFHGGSAHKIRDSIFHLMRGYVFKLDSKDIFAFGGAKSHDIQDGILDEKDFSSYRDFLKEYNSMWRGNKMFRVNHVTWWEQEMPSREEYDLAIKNLSANGLKVDYIVTHEAPAQVVHAMYGECDGGDELQNFLNTTANMVKFKRWFFGHHHEDAEFLIGKGLGLTDKYTAVYNKILRIT